MKPCQYQAKTRQGSCTDPGKALQEALKRTFSKKMYQLDSSHIEASVCTRKPHLKSYEAAEDLINTYWSHALCPTAGFPGASAATAVVGGAMPSHSDFSIPSTTKPSFLVGSSYFFYPELYYKNLPTMVVLVVTGTVQGFGAWGCHEGSIASRHGPGSLSSTQSTLNRI